MDSANSKIHVFGAHAQRKKNTTPQRFGLFKILRKERASITAASKLPARSPWKFNCSRSPLFKGVPIDRVVIDNLHLFQRVADNLNLLILELRRMDSIVKCTHLDKTKATNITNYELFIHDTCKIPFKFYVCEESRTLKWKDLSGTENYKFFKCVDHPISKPS